MNSQDKQPNVSQSGNIGVGINQGKIENATGAIYNEKEQKNLAEAAAEIQSLLKQLEKAYPTNTTSEKMAVAAQVINQIETNPSFKQKVIKALSEGGLAAFESAINNPVGAFIVGAIKGWQE